MFNASCQQKYPQLMSQLDWGKRQMALLNRNYTKNSDDEKMKCLDIAMIKDNLKSDIK
jgi:hypothetical protein